MLPKWTHNTNGLRIIAISGTPGPKSQLLYIYAVYMLRLINFYTLRQFPTYPPQSRLQVGEQSGEVGKRGLEVFDPLISA